MLSYLASHPDRSCLHNYGTMVVLGGLRVNRQASSNGTISFCSKQLIYFLNSSMYLYTDSFCIHCTIMLKNWVTARNGVYAICHGLQLILNMLSHQKMDFMLYHVTEYKELILC